MRFLWFCQHFWKILFFPQPVKPLGAWPLGPNDTTPTAKKPQSNVASRSIRVKGSLSIYCANNTFAKIELQCRGLMIEIGTSANDVIWIGVQLTKIPRTFFWISEEWLEFWWKSDQNHCEFDGFGPLATFFFNLSQGRTLPDPYADSSTICYSRETVPTNLKTDWSPTRRLSYPSTLPQKKMHCWPILASANIQRKRLNKPIDLWAPVAVSAYWSRGWALYLAVF